jgi:hypothetical protein
MIAGFHTEPKATTTTAPDSRNVVATKMVNEVKVEAVVCIGWPGHRPYFLREVYADGTAAVVGGRRWSTSKAAAEANAKRLLRAHR